MLKLGAQTPSFSELIGADYVMTTCERLTGLLKVSGRSTTAKSSFMTHISEWRPLCSRSNRFGASGQCTLVLRSRNRIETVMQVVESQAMFLNVLASNSSARSSVSFAKIPFAFRSTADACLFHLQKDLSHGEISTSMLVESVRGLCIDMGINLFNGVIIQSFFRLKSCLTTGLYCCASFCSCMCKSTFTNTSKFHANAPFSDCWSCLHLRVSLHRAMCREWLVVCAPAFLKENTYGNVSLRYMTLRKHLHLPRSLSLT
jgi:hypothetical protein